MQKLQDSVFTILKSTSLSPAVFSFLQPSDDSRDEKPQGGILSDTKYGWLSLGPKFCIVDLRTGLKVAAWVFGAALNNLKSAVTSVVELPTPLTENSKQLIISLECEDIGGMICVFHINGSQILHCIQTDEVVTKLAVCDSIPDGPFTCFDGVVIAGTKSGEVFVFDLNRSGLVQALKNMGEGNDEDIRNEVNTANFAFLPSNALSHTEEQRQLAIESGDHLAVLLNNNSVDNDQYLFRNPDGSIRMKAKRDHIRVSAMDYIPQLGSLAIGFNFGAFQIWNLMSLELEFTSQVNVECLPVTHFGFQEPCDDPRAFCYLWAIYSAIDRFEEEEFPLAVMYSLTYQGKRMLSDTKHLYQDFLLSNIRFQIELSAVEGSPASFLGGRCVSCHTYSINSTLGEEGEESMLNLCHLVWECWGDNPDSVKYGMLLFDLDQWYKDQMPASHQVCSSTFQSAGWCSALVGCTLDVKLDRSTVLPYSHATRLEEHFYPNSLHYTCISLSTCSSTSSQCVGIQRQLVQALSSQGVRGLANPASMYEACRNAGLAPLYGDGGMANDMDEQRRFLLSVALEARLTNFLKKCAHEWATGTYAGVGCTLPFMVDWCWRRALELKQNAKELTAPLFTSSALPDRNLTRCLEHCVRQLTELTNLLDAILTKCCNLIMPDLLSEIEEKFKGVGTVAMYFQVVQWFLGVGLLPERQDSHMALNYPEDNLLDLYRKRRIKLHRLQDNSTLDDETAGDTSCSLLYIDQLIDRECGGDKLHEIWRKGGSVNGLYPPPSLYSLLRVYLLSDVSEQHKHSLVLYLLVDYSMVYDDTRYEAVIRRLMQFPTMFGLSNTAIKATQAFWHLDHRDFDFALDQLQCLTGNTLSDWQHNVVLSALLAQKKTQAALQYLHVRKPAPVTNDTKKYNNNDWKACCDLYLARELVFEALDVVRLCLENAAAMEEKIEILNYFFKGCQHTGQLSKVLKISMSPLEEEVFVRYLKDINDRDASDVLIMYYLQQARYLEAQQYNNKMKHSKQRHKELATSLESVASTSMNRGNMRDTIVEIVCAALPTITGKVADYAMNEFNTDHHAASLKPLSVSIQAKSPKNTFTYKSSFIQDTIENASETWINRPQTKKGLKRVLNIEDTPFLCTPKLTRTKSIFSDIQSESTPPKRPKLQQSETNTPKFQPNSTLNETLSKEMQTLLEMPELQTPPHWKMLSEMERKSERATTPHSILKVRRANISESAPSPVGSHYLEDRDDFMETASTQTNFSESTKHLKFTIPSDSDSDSTSSQIVIKQRRRQTERERSVLSREKEIDVAGYTTASVHSEREERHLLTPVTRPSDLRPSSRRSYRETSRERTLHSVSMNSSLSDDPNASIESIADIPVTLVNPNYDKRRRLSTPEMVGKEKLPVVKVTPPKTLRRSPRGLTTPVKTRSRSITPDRQDSPTVTPVSIRQMNRSRTPEVIPAVSPILEPIQEQPKLETEPEAFDKTKLGAARVLRSRSKSRTPERVDKPILESPKLEMIAESPTKTLNASLSSPTRRSLRSRSRTPEVESSPELATKPPTSPRVLRSRSKTPDREKIMSPIEKPSRTRKSLSRMVLEHNAFVKTKSSKVETKTDGSTDTKDHPDIAMECTPRKNPAKEMDSLLDITFSPIAHKSVLQSSMESDDSEISSKDQEDKSEKSENSDKRKSLPAFTFHSETFFEKSVLQSYQSSVGDSSGSFNEVVNVSKEVVRKSDTLAELSSVTSKSVLKDVSSLMTSDSDYDMNDDKEVERSENAKAAQLEKEKIVEIEREMNEIKNDLSNVGSDDSGEDDKSGGSDDEEDNEDEEDSENSTEVDSDENADQDVISIADSSDDGETSSSENKLQIVENVDPEDREVETENVDKVTEEEDPLNDVNKESNKDTGSNIDESMAEPTNQAAVSILTDDNSMDESEADLKLTYSDEEKTKSEPNENVADNQSVSNTFESQQKVQIQVMVEVAETIATYPELTESSAHVQTDVVDAVTKNTQEIEKTNPVEPEKLQTEEKPASRTKKRTKSTSSLKSEEMNASVTKTPTRKRQVSTSAAKLDTSQIEDASTPNSARRRIMTRRQSKEVSELTQDVPETIKDTEEEMATPKRRSARSRSKTLDENVPENVIKGKEEEVEAKPVRKQRKSILLTKPDLSAIPETSAVEDSSKANNSEIIEEYASARRLTRKQKATLESWLDHSKTDANVSTSSRDEVGGSSGLQESFFLDTPEADVESKPRKRLSRAASESRSITKVTKPMRRGSVDVAHISERSPGSVSSDVSGSETRARRKCFNRACEALSTPKGRRTSVDQKRGDSEDPQDISIAMESPLPARRARRTSSTHSNTSVSKETNKRSKKLPPVEES